MAHFVFTNPNPTGKIVNDCAVRAISIANGNTWEETFMQLCLKGLSICDMPSSLCVCRDYLEEIGYNCHLLTGKYYTVEDFANDRPNGVYILVSNNHMVTVVDGNVCDVFDSRNEIPYMYFVREEEDYE